MRRIAAPLAALLAMACLACGHDPVAPGPPLPALWLDFELTGGPGFVECETITGDASGARGVMVSVILADVPTTIYARVSDDGGPRWIPGEYVTGSVSGSAGWLFRVLPGTVEISPITGRVTGGTIDGSAVGCGLP